MDTDHVVLVTGGNRGIGHAIAEAFLEAGYTVAVTARHGEGPVGARTVTADVTDADSLDAAVAQVTSELGPIEIVVANAGITDDGLLMRMSDTSFEHVIDTNLTGVFRTVKRCIKPMMRARWGRIILISSVVAMYGNAGQINYAAAKAGLIGMARSITRELGARGITANVIAPGFIDTDMTAELSDEQKAALLGAVPAQRFGTVGDIAAACLWLAREDAGYVSGAVIPVDGGLGMGH